MAAPQVGSQSHPEKLKVGLKGATSAAWLYSEYCSGPVKMPKPAWKTVRGRNLGW